MNDKLSESELRVVEALANGKHFLSERIPEEVKAEVESLRRRKIATLVADGSGWIMLTAAGQKIIDDKERDALHAKRVEDMREQVREDNKRRAAEEALAQKKRRADAKLEKLLAAETVTTTKPIESHASKNFVPPKPDVVAIDKHEKLWAQACVLSRSGEWWQNKALRIIDARLTKHQVAMWLTAMKPYVKKRGENRGTQYQVMQKYL